MNKKEIIIWADFDNAWEEVRLNLEMANRHWLIAWATWTWKTVTLQILIEQFSKAWVPVFASDVKWDLAWICMSWKPHEKVDERTKHIWINDWNPRWFSTVFWDLYWEKWHPVRTTVSEMWPILLSRLMDLSETQDALLFIAFKIADDKNWLILDLADLEAVISYMEENSKELRKEYWNISSRSIWAIRRAILVLEELWWDKFFGEPALQLEHLIKRDFSWNWVVNILDSRKLMADSRLYSTFLLWMISELFEQLPEVWDLDKPKFVFFFDEAHLLFKNAPKVLIEKIEQVVRLIRSKWVGIYFITQNPTDIPDSIRSQLWNRIQHALRAFTPKDQKAIKVVAETFRQNSDFDIKEALTDMKVWVWLVSCLDEKWRPNIVEKTLIRPPESRMWVITDDERKEIISRSPYYGMYEKVIDRESADEILEKLENEKELKIALELKAKKEEIEREENRPEWEKFIFWTKKKQGLLETVIKSQVKKTTNKAANKLVRGLLWWLLR